MINVPSFLIPCQKIFRKLRGSEGWHLGALMRECLVDPGSFDVPGLAIHKAVCQILLMQ